MNERSASTVEFSPVSDRMSHTSGMTKPKVAFICVHNSCRSQIAEALGKALASDVFESYSAGTETKPKINQDAVRLMKELYGIDNFTDMIADETICTDCDALMSFLQEKNHPVLAMEPLM